MSERQKQRTCSLCPRKYYAKDMCRRHYVRQWQKTFTYKAWRKKWRKKTGYKSVGAMHKKRFGGLREKVIQRDNERCVECGMTRQQHKNKYGRDITVDHFDGNGRYSDEQNNTLENLQTLCLSCHGRKDRNLSLGRSVI